MDHGRKQEPGGSPAAGEDRTPTWQRREPLAIDPVQYKAWCDDRLSSMMAEPLGVQQTAAQGVAGSPSPLPHGDAIQRSFGRHDVSGVEAHVGGAAATASDAMGAQAYATGNQVAFAAQPDLRLAAHEAAHVVQQRGGVALKSGVGQSGDAYEQHADAVADKVVAGQSAEALLDAHAGGGGAGKAVQKFDAGSGGHQGIERNVAGLDPKNGLGNKDNLKKPEAAAGTREQGANAIYSGNFMQDFSQLHAPFVHNMLKDLPKNPVEVGKGEKAEAIGDAGSEAITDSIIRALAILDVGPTLADQVIANPKNMQAYKPEQHVDQPMGYRSDTDSIVRGGGPKGALRPGKPTVQGGDYARQSKIDLGHSTDVKHPVDADRDRDLKGSAAPGRQLENAALFKVSDAGLQNHIYNSAEWCKNHWLQAAELGPNNEGRFHIGAGLHVIEDYFSHSNFIEVALNGFIDRALRQPAKQTAGVKSFVDQVKKDQKTGVRSQQKIGDKSTYVDTLFDQTSPDKKRQAVTTGSVSGIDMKGSIGHILLPKAPLLQTAIDGSIEKIFGLVVSDPGKVSSWAKLKELGKSDRPMAAVLALGDGVDKAGMHLPVPDGFALDWGGIDIPFTDREIPYPKGGHVTYDHRPVTSAIGSYISFVETARNTLQTIQDILGKIKYLGPVGYAAAKALHALIDKINKAIEEELKLVKQKIKQQLMLGMVKLIDSISGHDSRGEVNRTIGDALADVHDHVDEFEHQTSLEARLLPGGDLSKLSAQELEPIVGPVVEAPGGGWKAVNPLAPSHSEISKDHAGYDDFDTHGKGSAVRDAVDHKEEPGARLHPEQHQDGADHDHAEGSIFGLLARALATEADRHVLRQVEIVWADRGSLYGDGKALDTSAMAISQDAMSKEASGRAGDEDKRAKKDGFAFAQSDGKNAATLAKPGVRDLLNLVDVILAHPDDSQWSRSIVQSYVDGHPDEVARHIRERNSVRGNRRRIK